MRFGNGLSSKKVAQIRYYWICGCWQDEFYNSLAGLVVKHPEVLLCGTGWTSPKVIPPWASFSSSFSGFMMLISIRIYYYIFTYIYTYYHIHICGINAFLLCCFFPRRHLSHLSCLYLLSYSLCPSRCCHVGCAHRVNEVRTWLFKIDDERSSRGTAYIDLLKMQQVKRRDMLDHRIPNDSNVI